MDTIADPDIRFDAQGICNYYHDYLMAEKHLVHKGEAGRKRLAEITDTIKAAGVGKKYDCVVGLSGGVDSSYLAMLARELGLRPLAVHFDNGWNSEISVKNIEGVVNRLGLDLFTYVIDWNEFKDLQLAYLRASVIDVEAITDHAIGATLIRIAGERGIRHILSGTNVWTENTMPPSWIHHKSDQVNIRAIHRIFGTVPLKTFPFMDTRVKSYYRHFKGITTVHLLNCVDYDKGKVKERIQRELGWRDYGGKHYESVWTRFYQGHILPKKFGIDKRKAHLSDLIFSGQITKEEALEELKNPPYRPEQFRIDYDFVLKKLGLTAGEFEEIMSRPARSHYDFDHEMAFDVRYPVLRAARWLQRFIWPRRP